MMSYQLPVVCTAGDALNPSLMSTYMKGRQMIPFLNLLKVHTACLGNHDFDFGIDELEYTIGSCNFPWLLTNVFARSSSDDLRKLDRYMHGKEDESQHSRNCPGEGLQEKRGTSEDESLAADSQTADPFAGDYTVLPGEPIANAWKYRLFEWQGVRIGVIGLVERGETTFQLSVLRAQTVARTKRHVSFPCFYCGFAGRCELRMARYFGMHQRRRRGVRRLRVGGKPDVPVLESKGVRVDHSSDAHAGTK